ncbi:MAG TPA: hypothetical protein VHO25_19390 [Polyangiaceae bacterium]|nr:hypothetical protein [Polyangiaceae bacterium]
MRGWGQFLGNRLILLGLIASTIACGSAKPAGSADDADQAPAENVDAESEASSAESGAAEDQGDSTGAGDESGATDDSRGGGPAAVEDVQAVLQLVIDDDALQPFLKLEEPGRFPLRIAFGADVQDTSGVALTKMTKPVEIVDSSAASDPKQPAILITALNVEGDRARVTYRYKVEGVHGSASLAKTKNGQWELVNSTLTER